MPRFIVQRPEGAMQASVPPQPEVRRVRTFFVHGRTFDVYVAPDRAEFRRLTQRAGIPHTSVYG